MATNSDALSEAERIREMIGMLKVALEDCCRFLAEAEKAVKHSRQDNDPPGP